MKKHLIQYLTLILFTVLLTACGGGGEGTDQNGTEQNGTEQNGTITPVPTPVTEAAIAPCVETNNDQGYAQAKVIPAGKTIHKRTDPTTLRVWHLQSSERKACIVSGDAEVL